MKVAAHHEHCALARRPRALAPGRFRVALLTLTVVSVAWNIPAAMEGNTHESAPEPGPLHIEEAGLGEAPPAIDIRELSLFQEVFPVAPGKREPVLTIRLATGGSATSYPEDALFQLSIRFGEALPEATGAETDPADLVISARMAAVGVAGRRRGSGPGATRPRFAGFPGLAELGSIVPGREVIFRLPVSRLLETASETQRDAADNGDGTWSLLVWAESALEGAADRLPSTDDGGKPDAPPEVGLFRFTVPQAEPAAAHP